MIAAIGEHNELGRNNDLIWHISEDLKFFKEKTTGHSIVMGMNTFNSLPKKLPNRKHIILTSKDIKLDEDITIVHSINDLLAYIDMIKDEVFVIGGASLYNQLIEYANMMYLTEICASAPADVYFPEFNKDDWKAEELCSHTSPDGIDYRHVLYKR